MSSSRIYFPGVIIKNLTEMKWQIYQKYIFLSEENIYVLLFVLYNLTQEYNINREGKNNINSSIWIYLLA